MLSSALHSDRAIDVSIAIMRAFVHLRELLNTDKGLARKLEGLEKKYAAPFQAVFEAIRQLMAPPLEKPKGRMGFRRPGEAE